MNIFTSITTPSFSQILMIIVVLQIALGACKKEEEKEPDGQSNRAPAAFTVTAAPNLNSALITWTAATDPDGNVVSYSVTLEQDTLVNAYEQTFYEVMDLEYEVEYSGSVIASDPAGLTHTEPFTFTTGIYPNNAPMPFSLISPTDGSTDISTPINFNWGDAIDPDGDTVSYELLLDLNNQPTTSLVIDLVNSQYTYTEPELFEGQTYYWQVIAYDENGGETQSEIYSFISTTSMTLATDEPGWEDRGDHTSFVFQGKMWVLGGASCCGGRYGDVWSSTDGVNWVQELSEAPWPARTLHTSVVYDDKMWVIGGNSAYTQNSVFNDVWYSENGTDWVLATDDPAFSPRYDHHLLTYDGYMWLFGGRDVDITFSAQQTWRSSNGIDWELVVENNGMYYSRTQMVVFNDRMWRIAAYDDDRVFSSTNGIDWLLEQEESPFGERNGHSCAVHDGKIWLLTGSNNAVNEFNEISDVWSSEDGVNWNLVSGEAGFEPVAGAEALSFDGKLWLLGGSGGWQSFFVTNDVWYLE